MRPLGAILLAAALFPSFAAAEQTPSPDADIEFSVATVSGPAEHFAERAEGMLIPPSPNGVYSWTLGARRLAVNWTQETVWEHGTPGSLSEPKGRVGLDPPTRGEQEFGESVASSQGGKRESNALVSGTGQAAFDILGRNGALAIGPTSNQSWVAGRATDAASGDDPLTKVLLLPPSLAEASSDQITLTVDGNFSLYIWEAWANVTDSNGRHSFRSGSWVSNAPTGSQWVAWQKTYQLIRLDVTEGTLELTMNGRPARWAAKELSFQGNMSAAFQDATGSLRRGTVNQSISSEPFTIQGDARLNVWNATTTLPRMRGHMDIVEGSATAIATILLGPDPQTPAKGASEVTHAGGATVRQNPLWWLAAAVVALPLVFLLVGRVEPLKPDVTDVEWALLSGHPRRALRWARRLTRREPRNPDAVFLYGSTLLARGDDQEVLGAIEPLAEMIPRTLRRGIAFVLAVSSHRAGDAAKARRWAMEAAEEPLLLQQMQAEKGWHEILGTNAAQNVDRAYA